MIISEVDAVWAADEFIQYFSHMSNIEDYLRFVKKEVIKNTNTLAPLQDEFLNEDIHPEDMEFDIKFIGDRFQQSLPQEHYNNLLKAVSSHNNESNIPGRELRWMVFENNTRKVIGFIRFGSPLINSKPRNLWLGKQPDLTIFNRHAAMGFVIVPSQPFGYNYLGGKLLALLCCSHHARETLNTVFEKDIALFETTSLYGSTTDASQYDGLKPFMRYKGLTESKFLPLLHDDAFHKLHDRFTYLNNNTPLTDNKASSKKMKRQTKMISIIRNSLQDKDKLAEFNEVINTAFSLTQKKRFYISDYGYENVREVILGEQDKLRPGQNWDKFYQENIISWWKKKATKRYEKLKKEGRFRTKVELWTDDDEIQIIR
ncbi:MAG: DUF4338 domain-containing protein [Alphaproteobacteria bacterium]|nr:DUF4338 domain-containing protein [Alphaproteobacteria bacterium]